MIEVVILLGAVSVLTIAVMDAIRLTLGQIFSIVDGF
jgi:Flp pilus assembly pilin Flp|tara:strand:+ start:780 stop:890 length:111 start_codon:yes stop_codon:yes gene_type:complete